MNASSSLSSSAMSSLEEIFGQAGVATDSESLEYFGGDWNKHIPRKPSAIVFPSRTAQVVELVKWARHFQARLVPSGGRTGLSGGAAAPAGEVVVSFERMNRILSFDPIDRLVECEPGVVTEDLQKFALKEGLFFPVDFASRGSSQIGGNIATNAGGIKVVRYGLTRRWVMGLEVVTGAGEVLELNRGLVKNATGPDLSHAFIGSEGIFGFVTRALIQLTQAPPPQKVLMLSLDSIEGVMAAFVELRKKVSLSAYEFFTDLALSYVLSANSLAAPLAERRPYYVLAEFDETLEEEALEVFEKLLQQEIVYDGILSQSERQSSELWRYRESISESLSTFRPYKNDVSVRISKIPSLMSQVDLLVKSHYHAADVVWFGHVGDGNLHLNIVPPHGVDLKEFVSQCQNVDKKLYEIIQSLSGSISAEHGVGLSKKKFLGFSRSPNEIDLLKRLKLAFDPDLILNPGKVFD